MPLNNFAPAIAPSAQTRNETLECKCKSTWFEQVRINQYKADHLVIPGQGVPISGPQDFFLLRCIKCSELYQPIVMVNTQDVATKLYNQMLDQMEAK